VLLLPSATIVLPPIIVQPASCFDAASCLSSSPCPQQLLWCANAEAKLDKDDSTRIKNLASCRPAKYIYFVYKHTQHARYRHTPIVVVADTAYSAFGATVHAHCDLTHSLARSDLTTPLHSTSWVLRHHATNGNTHTGYDVRSTKYEPNGHFSSTVQLHSTFRGLKPLESLL
jgi:hypothetical protein